ncbi:MAG TPA: PorP/SprF family type IX secretion system membrane protein [Bacteroidaceae bacterium]|nr:PorP/SprF family type IX secretion system membrane protein [Bacteroidaceae bacterium]
MRRIRSLIFCFVVPLVPVCFVGAQTETYFAHHWEVDNLYNPAAMNKNEFMNFTGSFGLKMAGYTRAPQSMFFGVNTLLPYGDKAHSGGVVFLNESAGLFLHTRLYINYAYKINIKKGSLNIGIQTGFLSESFKSQDLSVVEQNDPAFPIGTNDGDVVDFGAGLYYMLKNSYVGVSAMHIGTPVVYYEKESRAVARMKIVPALYFSGGCNIQLKNPLLSLQPCFLVMTDLDSRRIDLTLRSTYQYGGNRFYCGLSHSPKTSITFLIGGDVGKVRVGYAYELYTSGIGYLNGSHDLFVGYSKEVDFFKKGKNTHKSVRYL